MLCLGWGSYGTKGHSETPETRVLGLTCPQLFPPRPEMQALSLATPGPRFSHGTTC